MVEEVLAQWPEARGRVEPLLVQVETLCSGSRIPGIGKVFKEFEELEKELVRGRGTAREWKVVERALRWVRGSLMPRRLLALQSRELMAVLRKLERALKERRYERVAALLEDNKEVLRAKQPDDVVERVRVWEEQVAGLLARRAVTGELCGALLG